MDIKIRKLTPELAMDYVRFFDTTPHDTGSEESKCYCVTWRNDASYKADANHWYPTCGERRAHAIEFVKSGSIEGYLAYNGEKIIGWCNANGNCQIGINYLRSFWPIEEYPENIKVKSVFCFVIAPEMQRKGIATALLEYACQDSANDGFDFIEAYVNEEEIQNDFRGSIAMYEKCGFLKYATREGKAVMRRALK